MSTLEKEIEISYITNSNKCEFYINGYNEKLIRLGFSSNSLPSRDFPDTYHHWTLTEKRSFLQGLFSANGSVINKHRIAFKSTCYKLITQLKKTLEEDFDIICYITTNQPTEIEWHNGTYISQESYDLNICRYDCLLKFNKYINFYHAYKTKALKQLLFDRAPTVTSVKPNGTHKVYDFHEPDTHWGFVEGFATHTCSEFLFINNSACNLASINLVKLLDEDNIIDIQMLHHIIEIMVIASDILVDLSSYPTREIAENSHAFRPVGLGFTNLGGLLMRMGIPYDSDEGRLMTKLLTSHMTSHAYATSAKFAKSLGYFPEFNINSDSMIEVIEMHKEHSEEIPKQIPYFNGLPTSVDWDKVIEMGQKYGFRNAQISVLAPTGTTGILMNCDSTGIEPVYALNTVKKLSGGGSMLFPNSRTQTAWIFQP